MQIINYLLASIISYLGLLVGVILIKMAPEEQKPGKKYFILIKKMIFFLIIAFLLAYYRLNLIFSLFLLLFLFILMLTKKMKLEKPALAYFFLGIIFFLSSKIIDLFVIELVLVFLYGIPAASLVFNIKKKNYKDIFIKNALFFIPIILLFLLF